MASEALAPWQVVVSPFPYTDRAVAQYRPSLVIATFPISNAPELVWVMMITSRKQRVWPGDVELTDLASAGLPLPSVVRSRRIAAVDVKAVEFSGWLCQADIDSVRHEISPILHAIAGGVLP